MPLAIEQVRRMRGGAQPHLMRCANEQYYVVKFQNNPQGVRILATELLGRRLAARLGLPTAEAAIVEVRQDLIENTDELVMQLGRGNIRCQPGLQFGSRYPGHPAKTSVHDFLPDDQLREVVNLTDFCGMLVFDKWTCNTNGRQAIFFRAEEESRYRAQMIDHGFCFNAGEWNFPDAPLRGIYARHRVYESVRGLDDFDPWLTRIETKMTEDVFDEIGSEVPSDWYGSEIEALEKLSQQLLRRRPRVRDLVESAWKSSAQPFPNWK